MPYFLIVQYPYETIDIALCNNELTVHTESLHKYQAIGQTIPTIQNILMQHQLALTDLACIGANVGPGPYNTLRGILTMMNGIHTVNGIPLISLNALDLLSIEHSSQNHIILLQAFENHLFYHLQTSTVREQGGSSISDLITMINAQPDQLHVYGNGAIKYQAKLEAACPSKLIFNNPIQPFSTLTTLAQETYKKYRAGQFVTDYLRPIYFEDMVSLVHKT